MIIKYKYTSSMPIAKKEKRKFISDFMRDRYKSFLLGKIAIWISPIIEDKIQFVFDLDFHKENSFKLKLMTKFFFLSQNLSIKTGIPYTVEKTPNGFHLSCQGLYNYKRKYSDLSLLKKDIKEIIGDNKYLDLNTTIRDLPIKRIGTDERGNTYYPLNKFTNISIANKAKEPIAIALPIMWENYIKNKLIANGNIKMTETQFATQLRVLKEFLNKL